jgi:hypothetical protein
MRSGRLFTPDAALFTLPADLFTLPADLFTLPADLFTLPADLFTLPADLFTARNAACAQGPPARLHVAFQRRPHPARDYTATNPAC